MKFSVNRDGKEIPLHSSKVAVLFLVFILSIVLAWYVGGMIGDGAVHVMKRIIDNAEECDGCDGKKRNFNAVDVDMRRVPIEVPEKEERDESDATA